MSGSWTRGFDAALAASEHSDGVPNRDKMGAAIFSGGRLLAVGFNIYSKTTPTGILIKNGKEILLATHAEVNALTKIKFRDYTNNKLIMYIARQNRNNILVTSKPCKMCQNLLILAGIRVVRYFNQNSDPEELKLF